MVLNCRQTTTTNIRETAAFVRAMAAYEGAAVAYE